MVIGLCTQAWLPLRNLILELHRNFSTIIDINGEQFSARVVTHKPLPNLSWDYGSSDLVWVLYIQSKLLRAHMSNRPTMPSKYGFTVDAHHL